MSSFPAAYAGRCGNCGEYFPPGAMVQYEEGAVLVIQECCGIADEPREDRPAPKPDVVMPRGKSAADRCGRCFQVPSSNGVCGCS